MSSPQQRMSMLTVKNPNRSTVQASSTSTSSYSAPTGSTEATMAQQQQQQQQQRKKQEDQFKCPRCDSSNTKFCYYNNYSLSQPRHFCKACKRYWTRGGTLRSVPVGGGCRKNKRRIKNKHNPSSSKAPSSSSLVLPPLNLTTDNNSSPNSLFYGLSSSHISLPAGLVRPVADMYQDIQLPHELMTAVALSGFSDNFHPNNPFSDHNINPPTTFLSTHDHYPSFESGTPASLLVSRLKQPKKIEIEGYLPMMPLKEDLQACSNNENLGLLKDHVKIEDREEISDVLVDNSIFEWPMNQFQPFTAADADATESAGGISDSSYHLLWNSEPWPDALGNPSLAPMI